MSRIPRTFQPPPNPPNRPLEKIPYVPPKNEDRTDNNGHDIPPPTTPNITMIRKGRKTKAPPRPKPNTIKIYSAPPLSPIPIAMAVGAIILLIKLIIG